MTAEVQLHLLPEAPDAEGEPRAALVVPPMPSRYDRRTVTLLFPSLAAALAEKRRIERTASTSEASAP